MSELKLPRLLAAAKEFNIGQDTLVEFLAGKGFGRDDLKPTAKLTEDMYRSLQQEFQGDKVAKNKADQIEIPKSVQTERKRRDEEEILSFTRREEIKPIAETVPAVLETEPVKVAEVAPEIPQASPDPEVSAPNEKEGAIVQIVKIEAPALEGPVVLDKIDLSTIDSSTRPKKTAKPKKGKEEIEPVPENETQPEAAVPPAEIPVQPEKVEQLPVIPTQEIEQGPLIENIKAEKLEGPKILGKIELPVDNDTRPKSGNSIDEKA